MNEKIRHLIIYFCAFLIIIYCGFPIYWMLISSIQKREDIITLKPDISVIIPRSFSLDYSYIRLFGTGPEEHAFFKYILNSVYVSSSVTLITLFISMFAGYSLAKFEYKGKKFLSRLIIFTYLIPPAILLVPFFLMISWLNLMDNLLSLIIVYPTFSIPFSVWMLRSFFESVPSELEESAWIDGASKIRTFFSIILPISKPIIGAIIAYSFITSWTEYMFAFTLISTKDKVTVPVAIMHAIPGHYIEWGELTAASFVSTIPVLLLFMPLAKYLIHGIQIGAAIKK